MSQRNLSDLDAEAKKYGGNTGSDKFDLKKGPNILRVLTFPEIIATHFFGKGSPSVVCVGIEQGCQFHGAGAPKDEKTGKEKAPSLKLAVYIIDRVDGKVKLAELPLSVRYGIQDAQNTPGFEFADFPMPYDIQVLSDPDNKDPKAKYRTTALPKFADLTEEEQKSFDESMARMTPAQYVEKRKDKVKGTGVGAAMGGTSEDTRSMPGMPEDKIQYPSENIDPNDIPF